MKSRNTAGEVPDQLMLNMGNEQNHLIQEWYKHHGFFATISSCVARIAQAYVARTPVEGSVDLGAGRMNEIRRKS